MGEHGANEVVGGAWGAAALRALVRRRPGALQAGALAAAAVLGAWELVLGPHSAPARLAAGAAVVALVWAGVRLAGHRGAAAALRAARELRLVHAAASATHDLVVCVQADGTVVYANEAYCAAVGRPRAQVLGAPIWSSWWSAGPGEWASHWQELERRGSLVIEKVAALPADEVLPVEIRASHVVFDGQPLCVSAGRGLRERRQVEAALRMASVGTLAAGMAHEINNPLAYVLSNLEWVTGQLDQAHAGLASAAPGAGAAALERIGALRPVLDEITEGAERIRSIVRDLRLFSRSPDRDADGAASADVVRTVRAAVSLASVEIRHRAQLVLALEDGLPRVAGDEHRLGQVFLNLLVNAAQAIPERHIEQNLIRVGARLGEAGEVLVEVEDTGSGMSPSTLAHVFEPFFTTRAPGTGTGLGLSICHGIVAELGGRITASSRVGGGTLFRVVLPVAPPSASRPSPRPDPEPATAPRGRILLVDDDPLVASAAARLLSDHEVETCHGAAEALRRCAGERFDLVLCDVLMPEMTGMDFQRRLHDEQPELAERMIFITGGGFTAEASAFLAETPNKHLAKPFDAERLRGEVARALGSAPRRSRTSASA